MLSVESSVWWDGQEYIIKQFQPNYSNGFTTYQVIAIHVAYEISRIRQRQTKTGTLTYTVNDVLSFYLSGNSFGFTWQVIGSFAKNQITDLGNGSGKDMLDKIVSTWPDAVFYPDNKNIRIYECDLISKNVGNRIDYLHDSPEMKLNYDSTGIVNQVMAIGKTKENSSDRTEYYFEPFLVTNQSSVDQWGLHPGDNVSDERFTDKNSMRTYALSQLSPEPTLSIDITEINHESPNLCEIRRLENRKANFVTDVEIVAFTYYPLDKAQTTSITLNNRAKTILNYKTAQQKSLRAALDEQRKKTQQAVNDAQKAYKSRLTGHLVTSETQGIKARAVSKVGTDSLPLYVLEMAEDNDDFNLSKGTQIAVQTNADGVLGLDAQIKKIIDQNTNTVKYRLSILGDSISTFSGSNPSKNDYFYPSGSLTKVSQTWWQKLLNQNSQLSLLVNNSWSGSRVTTKNNDGSSGIERADSLDANGYNPDIIVIYLGVNDFRNSVGLGNINIHDISAVDQKTFSGAYLLMLDKVTKKYPDAKIYACTIPYTTDSVYGNIDPKNNNGNYISEFNEVIRLASAKYGSTIVDLEKIGFNYNNISKLTVDGQLHPNEQGMSSIGKKVNFSIQETLNDI